MMMETTAKHRVDRKRKMVSRKVAEGNRGALESASGFSDIFICINSIG